MEKNNQKLNFTNYYSSLKKKPKELRGQICQKLGISQETFYLKLRNEEFDYPQKVVIAQIVGSHIEELFPEITNIL